MFFFFANSNHITFNCKKTVCIKFGGKTHDYEHFTLNGNDIEWVSEIKHLGNNLNISCVLLNGKDYITLVKLLTLELDKLSVWLKVNKLSLNVQKTYYMVFHRARIKIDKHPVVTMDNVCLNKTESLKYLGVIIDHKLNWTSHIAHVKNKISKGVGIMLRVRNYVTKKCIKTLYYSYIDILI